VNVEIYEAEAARASHKKPGLWKALARARKNGAVDLEEISHMPTDQLADLMRWWRIRVDSAKSLANGEWSGRVAVGLLREVHGVIQTYYYHSHAWQVAKDLKYDKEGHEYQMAAEMCRDEAKYWLAVGLLLGNSVVRQRAIQSLEEAVRLADAGTSAQALAVMELEMISGKRMNFVRFSHAFDTVVRLAPVAGGADRLAAASWEYMKGSMRAENILEFQRGLGYLCLACAEKRILWTQYPKNEMAKNILAVSRRLTGWNLPKEELIREFSSHTPGV
jgi:hypothetical protein